MARTPKRNLLVIACTLLAVAGAIVAVGRLQDEAAASRDAELDLFALRVDLGQLLDVPWGASPDEGDEPAAVRSELDWAAGRIRGSLTRLEHGGQLADPQPILAPFERSVGVLEEVLGLAAAGRIARASRVSSAAAHDLAAADRALQAAAARNRAHAADVLRQAQLGSAAVIVALFAAFAWFYGRVARARRTAERLARDNRTLLALSQEEALTDALTGLGNRRSLMQSLASATGPTLLALFDLDGFKRYNDDFGHAAGDALLVRLAERLAQTIEGIGTAYRMGGDEFCVVAPVEGDGAAAIARLAAAALVDEGEGFAIGCSYGVCVIPDDARAVDAALRLADQRMYEHKRTRRSEPDRQSADVLLRLLSERDSDLGQHTCDVAVLSELTARQLGVPASEAARIRLAAELHDVGKAAIPDAILDKPGPLDAEEWEFVRRHTVIGERIMHAAPSLAPAAKLVRWHHERHDGRGYPDGLDSEQIPLGARIIAVSDAFDAMIADRPYRAGIPAQDALAELRRCAGTQFDPAVVEAFAAVVAAGARVGCT